MNPQTLHRDIAVQDAAEACGGMGVQRDLDLVREIMLALEQRPTSELLERDELTIQGRTTTEVMHHLNLLFDAGFLIAEPVRTNTGRVIYVHAQTLSWAGHEFLDTVRDPEIWKQTKAGAKKAGGFSLKVVGTIAEAIVMSHVNKLIAGGLDG